MVHYMWETGFILTVLWWIVLVLITKDRVGTQGIGLLEVVWDLVEAVIYTTI